MEEHKIPTLTLTPDLDAAQPAAKEPDLLQKAEAAPEAGPDLSMLSPEEQQAVTAFAGQIDLTNANQVLAVRLRRAEEHRGLFRDGARQGKDQRHGADRRHGGRTARGS